ncbi:MAG: DUF6443 domain-containing protein [Cytophagales bacterium]|nr:DUF6443 domain-containing protein [Cytophagales bacterium]
MKYLLTGILWAIVWFAQAQDGQITGPQVICPGEQQDVLYQAESSNGGLSAGSHQWYLDGVRLFGITPQVYVDFPSDKSQFTLEVQGAVNATMIINRFSAGSIVSSKSEVCSGEAIQLTASDVNGPDGLWMKSVNGGSWTQLVQTPLPTFVSTISSGPITQTTKFRVQSGGSCGTLYSNEITVQIADPVSPGQISGDQIICPGDQPQPLGSNGAAQGGTGSVSYEWKYREGNTGTWLSTSHGGLTYAPDELTTLTQFRRYAIDDCGSVGSNIVTIQMKDTPLNPGQVDGSKTIEEGQYAGELGNVSAPSGGDGTLNYSWVRKIENGKWEVIPDASDLSFTPTGRIKETTQFRRVVTDDCKSDSTAIVTITVPLKDQEINYVATYSAREEDKDFDDIYYGDKSYKDLAYQYMDGLGRSVQQVAWQASPSGLDVVQPMEYNGLGQNLKSFLPFTNGTTACYQPDAIEDGTYENSPQHQFYRQTPGIAHSTFPFGITEVEKSPLARPLKQGAPGEAWQPDAHPVTMKYEVNGPEEVYHWFSEDFVELLGTYYEAGELTKVTVADEDGNQSITYTNKSGEMVLKRNQVDVDAWADTYYVYDIYGDLRVVVPPEGVKQLEEGAGDGTIGDYTVLTEDYTLQSGDANKKFYFLEGVRVTVPSGFAGMPIIKSLAGSVVITPDLLDLWAFQYEYDGRHRVIKKKVPGADHMLMVYDRWDRLLLSQDGNQRANNQWLFTKYDELNRPVITGLTTLTGTLESIRSDARGSNRFETAGSALHSYTNQTYPVQVDQVHSVTYYDTTPTGIPAVLAFSYPVGEWGAVTRAASTKGLVSATKTNVLGTNQFLWSVTYFDEEKRPLQIATQNLDGGTETIYNQYDFIGQVLKSRRIHDDLEQHIINESFVYDHSGRVLEHWHQLDDQDSVLLKAHTYNEISQVTEKNLHSTLADPVFEQSLDYQYNIRGWLKSINDPELNADPTEANLDLFGMELHYSTQDAQMGNVGTYDGNISAIKYSSHGNVGYNKTRGYAFTYDQLNRLAAADHFSNNGNVGQYDVPELTYDLNGNIETLKRNGTGNGLNDDLQYTNVGNRLMKVDDGANIGGFKDGTNTGDDYAYDANGNMTLDRNKDITAISYNFLNLPEMVQFANGNTVQFIYDAAGIKLQKVANIEGVVTKTDYRASVIYEDHDLSLIQHAAGRLISLGEGAGFDYQYHLADHLGNNRLTFSTTPENYRTIGTFEAGQGNGFQALHPHVNAQANTTSGGSRVELLDENGEVGAMLLLKVNKSDTLHLSVQANYEAVPAGNTFLPTAYNLLFGAFTDSFVDGEGVSGANSDAFNDAITDFNAANKGGTNNTAPRAFLNYILFDEDMKFVTSGFTQVSTAAQGIGVHQKLSISDIIPDREGYFLTYLSNENAEPIAVHFDDFNVYQGKTNVVQSDEYYPFGLTFNSRSRNGNLENLWRFQGQEHQTETNWDQYKWRNAMPELGRFFNVDPLAEKYVYNSPYAFSENHVTAHAELEGLEKWLATDGSIIHNQPYSEKYAKDQGLIRLDNGVDKKKMESIMTILRNTNSALSFGSAGGTTLANNLDLPRQRSKLKVKSIKVGEGGKLPINRIKVGNPRSLKVKEVRLLVENSQITSIKNFSGKLGRATLIVDMAFLMTDIYEAEAEVYRTGSYNNAATGNLIKNGTISTVSYFYPVVGGAALLYDITIMKDGRRINRNLMNYFEAEYLKYRNSDSQKADKALENYRKFGGTKCFGCRKEATFTQG